MTFGGGQFVRAEGVVEVGPLGLAEGFPGLWVDWADSVDTVAAPELELPLAGAGLQLTGCTFFLWGRCVVCGVAARDFVAEFDGADCDCAGRGVVDWGCVAESCGCVLL
jgi:hypothetical protein